MSTVVIFPSARLVGLVIVFLAAILVVGCAGSEANESGISDVQHSLEPTDEMQNLAEQQCLDDLSKEEGVVRAVDPGTDEVLVEVVVDCAEIR